MKTKRLIGILAQSLRLTLALLTGLQMAQAMPAATNRFVKLTGSDSACTQAMPCVGQSHLVLGQHR